MTSRLHHSLCQLVREFELLVLVSQLIDITQMVYNVVPHDEVLKIDLTRSKSPSESTCAKVSCHITDFSHLSTEEFADQLVVVALAE